MSTMMEQDSRRRGLRTMATHPSIDRYKFLLACRELTQCCILSGVSVLEDMRGGNV